MTKRKKHKTENLNPESEQIEPLPRDIQRVVESDPDGGIVQHLRYNRLRMIDGLYADRWLNSDQFLAADILRVCFDASRLVEDARGQNFEGIAVKYTGRHTVPEKPRLAYDRLMDQLSQAQQVAVTAIVLHDEHPNNFGKRLNCNGFVFLVRCLDRLVNFLA